MWSTTPSSSESVSAATTPAAAATQLVPGGQPLSATQLPGLRSTHRLPVGSRSQYSPVAQSTSLPHELSGVRAQRPAGAAKMTLWRRWGNGLLLAPWIGPTVLQVQPLA